MRKPHKGILSRSQVRFLVGSQRTIYTYIANIHWFSAGYAQIYIVYRLTSIICSMVAYERSLHYITANTCKYTYTYLFDVHLISLCVWVCVVCLSVRPCVIGRPKLMCGYI